MNRLTQYLYLQSFMLASLVTLALTGALWLVQSIKLIQLAVDRGTGASIFFELILLTLPQLLQQILPWACFIGVLFTFNRLIADSEIIVMRACGSSQWDLLRPALLVATTGAVVMLAMSLYFLPASRNAFKDLQARIRNQFAASLLQEGSFTSVSDRLTVYVRSRTADQLEGMLIEDRRDPVKPSTYTAEKGYVTNIDGHSTVVMISGTKSNWDAQKNDLSMLTFDRYTLDLEQFRDLEEARIPEPDERYIGELLFPSDTGNDERLRSRLRVEGHNRLISPLTCVGFVGIAVACLLTGELNRRGQTLRLLTAIGLAAAVQIVSLTTLSSATRGVIGVLPLYLIIILPAVAGFGLALRGRIFRGLRRSSVRQAEAT